MLIDSARPVLGIDKFGRRRGLATDAAVGWIRAFCIGTGLLLAGCGGSDIDPDVARKVIRDVEKARTLIQAEDYAGVLPVLDECVKSGLLQPMALTEVIAMRANALIHTGALDQAKQDIDGLESISAEADVVHGLRYLYWQKRGNATKAQAELRLAKKMNPQFKTPK